MDIRLNPFPFHLLHQICSLPNITPSSPSTWGTNRINFLYKCKYGKPTELTQTPKANTQNNKLKRNVKIVKTPLIPKAKTF
jgi:hypothetical protein